ncbi:site-specific integrase [Amphritea atlantica]|uniref:Site-specific integrase n=1 Tax=Amphritea atlantica TaxID=355243 RepID=A0ABY5GT28_9GAMM|nr:site-specific integrase [Amphritea atlantica]
MTDELLDLPQPHNKQRDDNSPQPTAGTKPHEDVVHLTTYIEKQAPRNKITIDVNGIPVTFDHPDNPELEFEQAERMLVRHGGNGGNNGGGAIPFHSVRTVFDKYITNKVRKNLKANEQTQNEHIQMLETCVKLLGPEENYYTLTYDDGEALKDQLLRLKDGRAKDTQTAQTIQPSRAKKILDRFKRLAKFAAKEGFNPRDISDDLDILFKKEEKSDDDKVYSEEDLQKLFLGYPYTQATLSRARDLFDYHFWLIPVLLYSGARLNEICQLQVGDIKQETPKKKKDSYEIPVPIHYIHIKNEYDDAGNKVQVVKNDSSRRKVPIHSTLIDLGFLDFVAKRKREVADSEQLFDGLYYSTKNKWAKKASDWYNGNGKMKSYRESCKIDNPKAKNLHTFRHTLIDKMTDTVGVEIALISRIVGHEISLQTAKYGKKQVALPRLKSEIELLDYDIELSHLNYESFLEYKKTDGKG